MNLGERLFRAMHIKSFGCEPPDVPEGGSFKELYEIEFLRDHTPEPPYYSDGGGI